jgi:hypothetical protein
MLRYREISGDVFGERTRLMRREVPYIQNLHLVGVSNFFSSFVKMVFHRSV